MFHAEDQSAYAERNKSSLRDGPGHSDATRVSSCSDPEPKVGALPVKVTASLMYPPGSSVLVSLMQYVCFKEDNLKVELR